MNPKQEGINYQGTIALGQFGLYCVDGSGITLFHRLTGPRFLSYRKMLLGLFASFICIFMQEASGKYVYGFLPWFLLVYLVAMALQLRAQRRNNVHPYSSGVPWLHKVFPSFSNNQLLWAEALLLGLAAWGSEYFKIPLSLWLGVTACSLLARKWQDEYAARVAESDAIAAAWDAETAARTLRKRRFGEWG